MKLYSKQQMSESFLIGTLLAVVGGFLDAYTYIARGGVFANAQTGNIVLMGMNLAEGRWLDAFACFIPIFAFACGVFGDGWIRRLWLTGPLAENTTLLPMFWCPSSAPFRRRASVSCTGCPMQRLCVPAISAAARNTFSVFHRIKTLPNVKKPPAITESFCFLYLARESELCWQSSSGSFLSHSAISFCFWSAYCSLSAVKKTRNKSVHFRLR